jgi:O-antigen/teichoic acid export membrane protein
VQPVIFLTLVLFYFGSDASWQLEDIIVMYAIASGLSFVIGLFPLKKLKNLPEFAKRGAAKDDKNTVTKEKVSRKHFFLLSLVDIIDTNIDLFLLKTFEGFEEVAFYSVAKRIASLVNMILFAANYSFSPIANKLLAMGSVDVLQAKIYKIVRLNIALGTVLIAVLLILKRPILSLFGEVYENHIGWDLYGLLLLSQWFNLALGMPGVLLNATGNERFALYTFTGCILLQALLAAWLLPVLGVVGMAGIYCFIILFWNVVLGVIAKRKTGVRSTFFI